jgi:hypothetical protein
MNIGKIIIIVLISVVVWGVSLFNGWLNEVVLFGRNITNVIFDKNKSISMDENVKTVKYGEFAYMLLTDITIPDNIINIESGAFKGNKLTSITIGSNISLDKNAFGFGFEDVYNGNDKYAGTYTRNSAKSYQWNIWDGDYQYQKISGTVYITGYRGKESVIIIPDKINGISVTTIASGAFRGKDLTGVTIPESVTVIGESAFRNNKLSSIIFPNNVTNIGEYSFGGNQLTRITLPNKVKTIGINAFTKNQIIRISIGENVTLGDSDTSGILGEGTGFNTAYSNNKSRAGVYTRSNTEATKWIRTAR